MAHISYYDYDNIYLKYATNRSGNWVNEITGQHIVLDFPTSLSLDAEGMAHISALNTLTVIDDMSPIRVVPG